MSLGLRNLKSLHLFILVDLNQFVNAFWTHAKILHINFQTKEIGSKLEIVSCLRWLNILKCLLSQNLMTDQVDSSDCMGLHATRYLLMN